MNKRKFKRAFSLMELMIVIVIIGILSAVGMVMFNDLTEKAERNSANRICKLIIRDIKILWTGCQAGIPLHLVNDWGNLDTSTDWCTHTKNNFTIVQEWESHFANVYKNPYHPNDKSDLGKALRETCSNPDSLKPGCVRITSHAYKPEKYWHFTCYNLDSNNNLTTYKESMIGAQ